MVPLPILLLVLLRCASVHAAPEKAPVGATLEKNGFSAFLQLARTAQAEAPSSNAVLTIFAPTDKAFNEFLARMNLTLADMKQRPGLSAAIVAYHVLPRIKGRISDVLNTTRQDPLVALTADNTHFLKFYMRPDGARKVVIEDVQNNTASVVKGPIEVGSNILLYGIDRVMLSGDVFFTVSDMLARHPQFTPLRDLFVRTGIYEQMKAQPNTFTVFAPIAKAVADAQPKLDALSPSELADVVRYHVVPAPMPFPAGLKLDTPIETTFRGHFLTFKEEYVPPAFRPYNPRPGSTAGPRPKGQLLAKVKAVGVVPEDGIFGGVTPEEAEAPFVTIDNIFANRLIVHGINAVLRPKLPSQQAAAQKPAAAAKPGSTGSKAPAADGAGRTGRRLQQGWRQGAGPSLVSAGITSTQSSIRAAVEGRSAASDATFAGSAAARTAGSRCWNCMSDNLAP